MDKEMNKVKEIKKSKKFEIVLLTVFGNLIYAMGVNLGINPIHLYSGGFTGIAQLIRTFLVEFLHIPQIPGIDYLGVIYFLINVPFFILAYKVMGRKFCLTTLVSIVMASAFLSLIPIPSQPIISDNILLNAILGGMGSGIGAGMVLRAGSSQGGQDLIGVCLAKTNPDFKVGTIGIIISICIYSICLFMYDVETVIYSMIFAVVTGFCVDKVH
ncbi:MAG: YitT family protein, partial [Mogibacterium sp.]|nr:YitT family protein [Mogibacterium sp.]